MLILTRRSPARHASASTIPQQEFRISRYAAVATLSLCGMLCAQQLPAPNPLASAHISPTLYFRSAASEASSRADLHNQIAPTVKALSTKLTAALPSALDQAEALLAALQTHAAFIKIQTLENTQDQSAKIARDQIDTDQTVLESAIDARLRRIPARAIPSLGKYALLAREAQRDAAHTLSPQAEQYRGAVIPPAEQAIADAYDLLDDRLPNPKGLYSSTLSLRRAAIDQRNAAYNAAAPEAATLLAELIDLENRDAAAQGFHNAADRKYQSLGLDDAQVTNILAAVKLQAPAYQNYQRLLAQHAATFLGVPSVHPSEIDLAAGAASPIPLDDAKHLILAALQPLGADYTQRFAQLLDPANGRLDLAGGPHRKNTGTSIAAYTAPTALYYSGYNGSLRDVSKIAHEGGHAIHREMMNASNLPIYQRSGPNYLFEGFAIFNELLLLDYAAQTAPNPQAKQHALEQLLSKISLELFVSAEETTFERALYTEAAGKSLLDRPKIDEIFRTSIAPYEYWPVEDTGQSRDWMRKSLLFEDPLYLVNYLYASVIAVALYDKSHTDPDFATKYAALLHRGFDADPQVLLATLGIHLNDPNLIQPAAHLLDQKTAELQQLYAQKPN
jgi:oligoendopeptidase F